MTPAASERIRALSLGDAENFAEIHRRFHARFPNKELSLDDIAAFSNQMALAGLLNINARRFVSVARAQQSIQRSWLLLWGKLFSGLLFMRFPLFDPSPWLGGLTHAIRFIWSRWFIGLCLAFIAWTAFWLIVHRDFSVEEEAIPDRSCFDLGGYVSDLIVAERDVKQHLMRWRVRERVVGHVVGVAVSFGAVPQHLDERHGQELLLLVGVGGVQEGCEREGDLVADVLLPVDRPVQQGRVVDAGNAQHRPGEVRREGGERPAHDPALRVAVVEQLGDVDHRSSRGVLESGMRCQAVRMDEGTAQIEEVEACPVLGIRDHLARLARKHRVGPEVLPELIRAAMEGIAMNLRLRLDLLRKYTRLENEILFVGGGAKSRFYLGIFADAFNTRIVKTNIDQDAGALGAAAIGAVGCGLWDGFEKIDEIHKTVEVLAPDRLNNRVYEKLLPVFALAADCQAKISERLREVEI